MNNTRFHYDNTYYLHPLKCGSINVHQVGDLCCEKGGYEVEGHRQKCFEFSLIVSGKAIFSINGEEFSVSKGDLICNLTGDYHAIFSDVEDPLRMLYFGFSIDRETAGENSFRQLEERLCTINERIVPGQDALCEAFFRVLNELHQEFLYSEELTEAFVSELLILACRSLFGQQQFAQNIPQLSDSSEKKLVQAVFDLLDSETVYVGRLSSIGEKLRYNYSYLSQVFTKKVGMSLTNYFHLRLFVTALEALKNGDSVTTVAEKLGYTSVANFSRAFANYFGISPSRFREIDARWLESGHERLELAKNSIAEKTEYVERGDQL